MTNQEQAEQIERLTHAIVLFAEAWVKVSPRIEAPAYFHQAAQQLLLTALRRPDA